MCSDLLHFTPVTFSCPQKQTNKACISAVELCMCSGTILSWICAFGSMSFISEHTFYLIFIFSPPHTFLFQGTIPYSFCTNISSPILINLLYYEGGMKNSVGMLLPGLLVCLNSVYYLKCGLFVWKCSLLFYLLSCKYGYFYMKIHIQRQASELYCLL